jgi:hypothetical protein
MKLYIISRSDLGLIHQAIQSGHVVAQWCLEHPQNDWQNKTLIYLQVSNKKQLVMLRDFLRFECDYEVSEFIEPDIGYQVTAIAVLKLPSDDDYPFRKLKLYGHTLTGLLQKDLRK